MVGYTGANTYVNYGYESTFKTPVTANKCFGHNVSISTLDKQNLLERLYDLSSQDAYHLLEGVYEGALAVEFDITNPWFLKGLLGSLSSAPSGSTNNHTFTPSNTPPSLTIEHGIDLATDAVMKYLGCVMTDARFTFEKGNTPARCSCNFLYANESKATSGIGSQVNDSEVPYHFSYASLEVPSGAEIATTERVEINVRRNVEMIYGLHSRNAIDYVHKAREYEVTTVNLFKDASTYLEKLYGSASGPTYPASDIATVVAKLNNGVVNTAGTRNFTFSFANAKVDRHSLPIKVNEKLMETVTIIPRTLTSIVCQNATASMP